MFIDPLTIPSPAPSSAFPSRAASPAPSKAAGTGASGGVLDVEAEFAVATGGPAPALAAGVTADTLAGATAAPATPTDVSAADTLVALMSAMGLEETVFRRLTLRRGGPRTDLEEENDDGGRDPAPAEMDAFVFVDAEEDEDDLAPESYAVPMPLSLARLFPEVAAHDTTASATPAAPAPAAAAPPPPPPPPPRAGVSAPFPNSAAQTPLSATRNALGLTGVTPRAQGTIARRRRARYARFMAAPPAALLRVTTPRERHVASRHMGLLTPVSQPASPARTCVLHQNVGDERDEVARAARPRAASMPPAPAAAEQPRSHASAFAAQITAAALRRAAPHPPLHELREHMSRGQGKRARTPSPVRGRTLGTRRGGVDMGVQAGMRRDAVGAATLAAGVVDPSPPPPGAAVISSGEGRALAAAVTQLRAVVSEMGGGLVRATQAAARADQRAAAAAADAERLWGALNRVESDNMRLHVAVRLLRSEARAARARDENAIAAATGGQLVPVPAAHAPIPESFSPIRSPADVSALSPPELRAWVAYYLNRYVVGDRATLLTLLRHKLGVPTAPARPAAPMTPTMSSDTFQSHTVPVVPVSLDMLRPPPAPKPTTRPLPPIPDTRPDRRWSSHTHFRPKFE